MWIRDWIFLYWSCKSTWQTYNPIFQPNFKIRYRFGRMEVYTHHSKKLKLYYYKIGYGNFFYILLQLSSSLKFWKNNLKSFFAIKVWDFEKYLHHAPCPLLDISWAGPGFKKRELDNSCYFYIDQNLLYQNIPRLCHSSYHNKK